MRETTSALTKVALDCQESPASFRAFILIVALFISFHYDPTCRMLLTITTIEVTTILSILLKILNCFLFVKTFVNRREINVVRVLDLLLIVSLRYLVIESRSEVRRRHEVRHCEVIG